MVNPTSLQEIRDQLHPFDGRANFQPDWRECLRLQNRSAAPSFGDVRTADDWYRVPVDQPVRAVYLIDEHGPVIRWCTDKAAIVLGGFFHDYLERGDGGGAARSGWLIRRLDGSIEVKS